jgi:hypothetical protein
MYLAKNKIYAVLLYCVVNAVVYQRGDTAQLEASMSILAGVTLPILIPGVFSWFARWGFMESLAKDSGSVVSPDLVSFFFWLVLIVVSTFFLFNLSLY